MVEEAQEKKAPIERMLNRYAKFYTPVAIVLGALLWWWSGDMTRAITMLIVFCPCVRFSQLRPHWWLQSVMPR